MVLTSSLLLSTWNCGLSAEKKGKEKVSVLKRCRFSLLPAVAGLRLFWCGDEREWLHGEDGFGILRSRVTA